MIPLFSAAARAGVGLLISGTAFITSLNFFKKKQPVSGGNISVFETGKLVIYGLGLFLAYKLAKEVLK